jgi:anhydro-N-acetylmuramic acid kinase
MSGTSADGVDAAVVRVDFDAQPAATLVAHRHVAYAADLRRDIFTLRGPAAAVTLAALARVARGVSLAYAEAVHAACAAAGVTTRELSAIAVHGQTLYHAPPDTIQWIDPALLAAETGCRVVSDFRRADCAAGGQGAPLVPFADYALFRHPTKTRVLLNIGGIANLTFLKAGGTLADVIAFDTGPGNCVSDHLIRAVDPAGPGFDPGGEVAARGVPVYPLLQPMLTDPYFAKDPPKSTDGPYMVDLFLRTLRAGGRHYPFDNLVRTACLLTATTIADAIRRLDPFPDELIVSGGGVRNATMMRLLRQPLGDLPVRATDDLGVPAEAKEAVAFAILGAATLRGMPSNVPSATGARRAVVMGSMTPRP